MKSREEIQKMAQELCPRSDAECAIFISGYIKGYEDAQNELEDEQDRG